MRRSRSLIPALLNSMTSVPPVRFDISALSRDMLSGWVTSRVRISIPFASSEASDFVDRAVAKTRKPLAANSRAKAWPAPPSEQLYSA